MFKAAVNAVSSDAGVHAGVAVLQGATTRMLAALHLLTCPVYVCNWWLLAALTTGSPRYQLHVAADPLRGGTGPPLALRLA
jgi:hypothetical protein